MHRLCIRVAMPKVPSVLKFANVQNKSTSAREICIRREMRRIPTNTTIHAIAYEYIGNDICSLDHLANMKHLKINYPDLHMLTPAYKHKYSGMATAQHIISHSIHVRETLYGKYLFVGSTKISLLFTVIVCRKYPWLQILSFLQWPFSPPRFRSTLIQLLDMGFRINANSTKVVRTGCPSLIT